MSDKAKRKNSYRRWYAFRGLLLAQIIFMGAVGYFLAQELEDEYIYFVRDEIIWRISTQPVASPEPVSDIREWKVGSYQLGDGNITYSTDDQTQIRQLNFETSEDTLLLDCLAVGGLCISFDLHADENLLAYNFYYVTSEPPHERFQVRLSNIEQHTDEVLVDTLERLYRVRWVNEHQLEFTTLLRDWWSYDLQNENLRQLDLETCLYFSPSGSHYVTQSYNTQYSRWYMEYRVYGRDNIPSQADPPTFITESNQQVAWRPNGEGLLYHEASTSVGMPINRLSYYDTVSGQRQSIFEQEGVEIYSGSWSPSGRYILIHTSLGVYLYELETNSSELWLNDFTNILGWASETDISCYDWLTFPAG